MKRHLPTQLFGHEVNHIHCVGVGGMGLAPLAIYLVHLGYVVSGEDDSLSMEVRALLVQAGVDLTSQPVECELVVLSSAIDANHRAVTAALKNDTMLVKRGELMAEVLKDRKLVAVCGSHGKTTTTAMLISILRETGTDAGYILGGLFSDRNIAPARVGTSDWVVAEIDESDGTIFNFAPEITHVVNLDWDHVDQYRRAADLMTEFKALFQRTQGSVLVNQSCELALNLSNESEGEGTAEKITFGVSGDFAAVSSSSKMEDITLDLGGRFSATKVQVRARGDFNAINATGALAAAQLMGVSINEKVLAEFPGVHRRQTILSKSDGMTILEDYAHHPTEITALIKTLREQMGLAGRLVVVFQPHRFSRTAQFLKEFAVSLSLADRVHLLDVYGADEKILEDGTTPKLYDACVRHSQKLDVDYHVDDQSLFEELNDEVQLGDFIAFVGAGSIDRKVRLWLESRQKESWKNFAATVRPELSPESILNCEESMAGKNTMRLSGAARVYAEPATLSDLQLLVKKASADNVPIYPLGRGSNLIVPDEGVDGLVISLAHPYWETFELREEGCVRVGAGLRLRNLCGLAAKAGLVGFEFLEGIPGNIGGALRMNAGAMGGWMFDVVEEVELMTRTGEVITRKKSDMQVEYRHCIDLDDAIALGALLRPSAAADLETVKRQIDVYRDRRKESQPRESSAGCIFKNPPGGSAGQLIDEVGLKGERVGDAEVSTTHANFIINQGHATGADILDLIRKVRRRVHQVKGVMLEPEAQLFGRKWEDVL